MPILKTLENRLLLNHSRYLRVEEHTVGFPDGRVVPRWPWVITPDYIIVLPRTRSGLFLCFRQPKYAIEGLSLAPVGGGIDPGEEPLATARRELLEETGYHAETWLPLGAFRVDGNFGCGTAHLYFADRAEKVQEPTGGDLEEQEPLFLDQKEIRAALLAGEFKVIAWSTTVALTLLHLQSQPGS